MKIYTIAIKSHECYGHGDYGTELKIARMGSYGSGGFPPAFLTRHEAAIWLATHPKEFFGETAIVELELKGHSI